MYGFALLCLLANALASSPAWAVTPPKVIYEIFPRSFQDSDGDGVGDLKGVISRLDYLNDGTPNSLGVDAIWLTPIFPSPSYHGYDILDYQAVRSEYGDLNVLKKLIVEAHKRGIRVLLDIAVNHTSIQHPWFPDPNLYLWSQQPLDWHLGQGHWNKYKDEYYFASFSAGMPDLNWRNSQVLSRIEDVFKFWVSVGIDGFRLDAAKFLVKGPQGQDNQPETHAIWKQVVQATRQLAPETFFVGEVWDSAQNIASYYGEGDELDAAFDFPTMSAIRGSFKKRDANAFSAALSQRLSVEPTQTFAAPFAGNHDLPRLATQAGNDVNLEKLAAVAVMTLPGPAELYYGDEIGIPQGNQRTDLGKRTPMQWDNSPMRGFTTAAKPWTAFASTEAAISVQSEQADPVSLLNGYKKLIHLRAQNSFFSSGLVSEVRTPAPGVVSFVRSDPGRNPERALVILNFSSANLTKFEVPLEKNDTPIISTVWGHASASPTASGVEVSNLAAENAAIFILSPDED